MDQMTIEITRLKPNSPELQTCAAWRYEAFLELAPAMLARAARTRSGPALARTIADWEAANRLAGDAVALSFDAQAVAFDLACKVAALGNPN